MRNDPTTKRAVRAAAEKLRQLGYTRNTQPDEVDCDDAAVVAHAVGMSAIRDRDVGWLLEMISEGHDRQLLKFFGNVFAFTRLPPHSADRSVPNKSALNWLENMACEWAEPVLREAIPLLPSDEEIARGRHVDQAIKHRKEVELYDH